MRAVASYNASQPECLLKIQDEAISQRYNVESGAGLSVTGFSPSSLIATPLVCDNTFNTTHFRSVSCVTNTKDYPGAKPESVTVHIRAANAYPNTLGNSFVRPYPQAQSLLAEDSRLARGHQAIVTDDGDCRQGSLGPNPPNCYASD